MEVPWFLMWSGEKRDAAASTTFLYPTGKVPGDQGWWRFVMTPAWFSCSCSTSSKKQSSSCIWSLLVLYGMGDDSISFFPWVRPGSAQWLLLALHSEIAPGKLGGSYEMPERRLSQGLSQFGNMQDKSPTTVQSLQPQMIQFLGNWWNRVAVRNCCFSGKKKKNTHKTLHF